MASIILILAGILELVRGLLCLFSSPSLAKFLGLEHVPASLVFAYPLGATLLTFAFWFFVASKDPVKYKVVVNMGALLYGMATVSLILAFVRLGAFPLFWWIMTAVTLIMFVLFVAARPREKKQA